MDGLPHDFVSLPIIITDYDALQGVKQSIEVSSAEIDKSQAAADSQASSNSQQGEGPAFTEVLTDAAEEVWNRLSNAMKSKVREACFEVLRRVDNTSSRDDTLSDEYDDDARFLD